MAKRTYDYGAHAQRKRADVVSVVKRLQRRIMFHAGMVLLVLFATIGAVDPDAPSSATPPPPRSLVERWLDPQTIIAAVLVLLYVGELRGDMKRMKERLAELSPEKLNHQFMPREALDERLRHLEDRRARSRGESEFN